MTTTVSTKGQIVLPAEFRLQDDIEPGQEFEVQRIDRGEYRLGRRQPPTNERLVDSLFACPEKKFFIPLQPENPDTLRSLSVMQMFFPRPPKPNPKTKA